MNIGIDLGGSHIAIGIINRDNNIVKRYERDFSNKDKQNIIQIIKEFIKSTISDIILNNNIGNDTRFNIGMAIPGTIKDGKVLQSVNLGIKDYDIVNDLKSELYNLNSQYEFEIRVRNDVKCAALAEYKRMIQADEIIQNSNMLFLGIGTGIGGAYIYRGQLLEGNNYIGTEIGHMTIKENGISCKCGKNGCFERYGSILEFKNKVKNKLQIDSNINSSPLRDIMNSRANEIANLKEEYENDLSVGISNLVNIFEPDIIVIGGGFTHFDYMFMDDLRNKLINGNLLFNKRDMIDLRTAKLGNDAGMIGSTLMF